MTEIAEPLQQVQFEGHVVHCSHAVLITDPDRPDHWEVVLMERRPYGVLPARATFCAQVEAETTSGYRVSGDARPSGGWGEVLHLVGCGRLRREVTA